jgi:hypothetical protein
VPPVVEPECPPHQRGPREAVGDAVKAACLDQNPHVLELEVAAGPGKKIIKAAEYMSIFGLEEEVRRVPVCVRSRTGRYGVHIASIELKAESRVSKGENQDSDAPLFAGLQDGR